MNSEDRLQIATDGLRGGAPTTGITTESIVPVIVEGLENINVAVDQESVVSVVQPYVLAASVVPETFVTIVEEAFYAFVQDETISCLVTDEQVSAVVSEEQIIAIVSC